MRTSSRLPESLEPNILTRELARLRSDGEDILDLTVSNPLAVGLGYPDTDLRAALDSPEVCGYSPDARGQLRAREAVAAWHGHGLSPEDVLLTASTSEAYAWLFKLLGDPGDELLVPIPSYPLFEWLARLEGLRAVPVSAYFHERWHLDLEALGDACTPRTRAIVAVNPNNPTGQFLSRSEWQGLTELCARRGLALIVDEVFGDYALEALADHLPTALEDADPPCPVFVLSGLSKIAALPQVKLGWVLARGAQAKALMEPLAFIADQFLSPSASAQAAVPALLQGAPAVQGRILQRLRGNLAVLDQSLVRASGLSRLPVEGGWTVLLRRPAIESDEAAVLRLLRGSRVLVHPGHYFDLPEDRYLVLSLICRGDAFRRGLELGLPGLRG
jgi:alanine-synthesizing transaminase